MCNKSWHNCHKDKIRFIEFSGVTYVTGCDQLQDASNFHWKQYVLPSKIEYFSKSYLEIV